jgi:excisionase family DNA binding protein
MELLNVRDAATLLGIQPGTLYRWATTRKIPHVKVGDRLLFDRHTLQQWLARRTKPEEPLRARWQREHRSRHQRHSRALSPNATERR